MDLSEKKLIEVAFKVVVETQAFFCSPLQGKPKTYFGKLLIGCCNILSIKTKEERLRFLKTFMEVTRGKSFYKRVALDDFARSQRYSFNYDIYRKYLTIAIESMKLSEELSNKNEGLGSEQKELFQ